MIDSDKTKYLDPLLTALGKGTFINQELERAAALWVFWSASFHPDDRAVLVKRFFDQPAIPAKYYSSALYNSFGNRERGISLFHWLLKNADLQDLQITKDHEYFSGQVPEFRDAVKKAVTKASLVVDPIPRPGITLRRIETLEALKDILPHVILNLVDGYIEWYVGDHGMKFEPVHRKRNALLGSALAEYIP